MAGTVATVITYPFDLLRTRFALEGTTKIYSGFFGALVDISRKERIGGFYRGLTPSVISIIPQMVLQQLVINSILY